MNVRKSRLIPASDGDYSSGPSPELAPVFSITSHSTQGPSDSDTISSLNPATRDIVIFGFPDHGEKSLLTFCSAAGRHGRVIKHGVSGPSAVAKG